MTMITGRALRFFKIGPVNARRHFAKGDPVAFPEGQFADLELCKLVARGPAPSKAVIAKVAAQARRRARENPGPSRAPRRKRG